MEGTDESGKASGLNRARVHKIFDGALKGVFKWVEDGTVTDMEVGIGTTALS